MNMVSPDRGHRAMASPGTVPGPAVGLAVRCQISRDPRAVGRAQRLRHRVFFGTPGLDCDAFDAQCDHGLVESASGLILGCFRVRRLHSLADLVACYAAQVYDLSGWSHMRFPMVEVGRFCLNPDQHHPDTLRAAWAAITRYVERCGAGILFGCASFPGCDPARYHGGFDLLAQRHLGPEQDLPGRIAPETILLAGPKACALDAKQGITQIPPLLRSYLRMGGWVSDHAVIDRSMNTLHVLTVVDVAQIPEARKTALRRLAQALPSADA